MSCVQSARLLRVRREPFRVSQSPSAPRTVRLVFVYVVSLCEMIPEFEKVLIPLIDSALRPKSYTS